MIRFREGKDPDPLGIDKMRFDGKGQLVMLVNNGLYCMEVKEDFKEGSFLTPIKLPVDDDIIVQDFDMCPAGKRMIVLGETKDTTTGEKQRYLFHVSCSNQLVWRQKIHDNTSFINIATNGSLVCCFYEHPSDVNQRALHYHSFKTGELTSSLQSGLDFLGASQLYVSSLRFENEQRIWLAAEEPKLLWSLSPDALVRSCIRSSLADLAIHCPSGFRLLGNGSRCSITVFNNRKITKPISEVPLGLPSEHSCKMLLACSREGIVAVWYHYSTCFKRLPLRLYKLVDRREREEKEEEQEAENESDMDLIYDIELEDEEEESDAGDDRHGGDVEDHEEAPNLSGW